jgi:hypothetical protein
LTPALFSSARVLLISRFCFFLQKKAIMSEINTFASKMHKAQTKSDAISLIEKSIGNLLLLFSRSLHFSFSYSFHSVFLQVLRHPKQNDEDFRRRRKFIQTVKLSSFRKHIYQLSRSSATRQKWVKRKLKTQRGY